MAGSSRSAIVNSLVTLFKTIDGTSFTDPSGTTITFESNLFDNVTNRLQFLDEVTDFPNVSVVADDEIRQYLPGEFKWGFLNVIVRVYVEAEFAEDELEKIIVDIENLLDANNNLAFGAGNNLVEIRIQRISTDGGSLSPLGFGEVQLECRYEVK